MFFGPFFLPMYDLMLASIMRVWLRGLSKLWTEGCVSRMCRLKFPAEMEFHSVFLGQAKTVSSPVNSGGRIGTCSEPTTLSLSHLQSFLDKSPVHMSCSSFLYSGSFLKRWLLSRITTALSRSHHTCEHSLEKRSCSGLALEGSSCRKLPANIIEYLPNGLILSPIHSFKRLSSWIISESFMKKISSITIIWIYFHSSISSWSNVDLILLRNAALQIVMPLKHEAAETV